MQPAFKVWDADETDEPDDDNPHARMVPAFGGPEAAAEDWADHWSHMQDEPPSCGYFDLKVKRLPDGPVTTVRVRMDYTVSYIGEILE
jgi:hypothetical protein